MNDPAVPPGEGILELARALGRLLAVRAFEAEQQLLNAIRAEIRFPTKESASSRTPERGDELVLNGVSYRYDGSTGDGEHFTRLESETCEEALVSLRRGSVEAEWMLSRLEREQ